MIINCHCCVAIAQFEPVLKYNVNEAEQLTGWYWGNPYGSASGRWYCPSCMNRIQPLVDQLMDLLKGDDAVPLARLRQLAARHKRLGRTPMGPAAPAVTPGTLLAEPIVTADTSLRKTVQSIKTMMRGSRGERKQRRK
jgi:hypothetical protein